MEFLSSVEISSGRPEESRHSDNGYLLSSGSSGKMLWLDLASCAFNGLVTPLVSPLVFLLVSGGPYAQANIKLLRPGLESSWF